MEKTDSLNRNFISLGPWNHGQWADSTDHLGEINFKSYTTEWFKVQQKKWFDYWLKSKGGRPSKNDPVDHFREPASRGGDIPFQEAWCFQTGSDEWKSYPAWPPENTVIRKLYTHADYRCSFEKPSGKGTFTRYISDPSHPVPYRRLPIQATYGPGSQWDDWQVEDQRFVYTRPDVASFESDTLSDPLTVTGDIKVHLYASTSGTDADWIVKLIDVYPGFDPADLKMSEFQFPVAMEIFRGRYRNSFTHPEPLISGQVEEFTIDLHEINHVFKPGHRLMIQVQSSWFPVIDRNPQKFVPNIFRAAASDYIPADQKIYCSADYPTHIDLPVFKP
jgi:hypothetical protein